MKVTGEPAVVFGAETASGGKALNGRGPSAGANPVMN